MIDCTLRYKHDCDSCTYLGAISYPAPLAEKVHEQRTADLYLCNKSLIARFSSTPGDYASTDTFAIPRYMARGSDQCTAGPALIAAYWFAVGKNLLTHEP